MAITFEVVPFDYDSEHYLYPHEERGPATFKFEPGITILCGANGAGKTTLMKRMQALLKNEGTPVCALMRQSISRQIESIGALRGDMNAIMNGIDRNYLSEGQGAKHAFAFMLGNIHATIMEEAETPERWIFIDGIDSSQSIDQLRDISGLFDAIIETAPEDREVYLIASTNQFELAKNRRCLNVSDNFVSHPKTYREFERIVMSSARYLKLKREVSDADWEDVYDTMRDRILREDTGA